MRKNLLIGMLLFITTSLKAAELTPAHNPSTISGDKVFTDDVAITGTLDVTGIITGDEIIANTITVRTDHLFIDGDLLSISSITAPAFYGSGAGLTGIGASALDLAAVYPWTGAHSWTSSATFTNPLLTVGVSTFVVRAGNVGIGDTAPSALLSLLTGNSGPTSLSIVHGTTNLNPLVTIREDALVDHFRIMHGGNIGMGDNSPDYRLDVDGDAYFASSVTVAGGIHVDTITVRADHLYIDGDVLIAGPNFSVGVSTLVTWAGRVGIGTPSPDSTFHIKASVPGVIGSHAAGQLIIQNPADDVDAAAVITGYESDGSGDPDQQLWYLGSSSGGNENIIFLNRRDAVLALATSGYNRITILGNGNVGIANASPVTLFEVGDGTFNVTIGGNIGVGTSNPATLLDVAGASQFGAIATKSTITATGRWTQAYDANCITATPDAVGQLCVQDDAIDTIFVASDTNAGGFVEILTEADLPFAQMYISTDNASHTDITGNYVFVKATGTCGTASLNQFTESAECTLRYDGAITRDFLITVSLSVSKTSGGATTGYFRIVKNGTPGAGNDFLMQSIRSLPNTADVGSVSITTVHSLSTNETIELWITTADADDITIESMSLAVQER